MSVARVDGDESARKPVSGRLKKYALPPGRKEQRQGAKVTHRLTKLRVINERERNDLDDKVWRETQRPKTRGDCENGPRPCPWVSCRAHLYLEANRGGSITFPFGEIDIDEMGETCSLDLADAGGLTLDVVGMAFGITRERARQTEAIALRKIANRTDMAAARGSDPLDWPTHHGLRAGSE